MKNRKKVYLGLALIALIGILGLTYAALTFNETKGNSQLVLGDIYMHYQENNALSIQDAMPGSDYSKYFEFTISGKNTYTEKDIYYDFILTRGDVPDGKIEVNRIPDKYLKFKLVSVDTSNQETVLLEDKTYNDLTNKRIYVETISKNTTSEVNRKYRLYMTIDESLEIGNSETALFGMEEWNNAFASVKVSVTGDFNEKELESELEVTDASCFTTRKIISATHNTNITDEEVATCSAYLTTLWGEEEDTVTDDETYEAFCRGTGTVWFETFQDRLDSEYFNDEELTYLEENNIIVNKVIEGLKIIDYDESCGTDVFIPNTINGYSVTQIGAAAFYWKNLTSVEIPDSVTAIESSAFSGNNLTSVEIPETVVSLGHKAFHDNKVTEGELYIYNRTDTNGDGIAEIVTTSLNSYVGASKNIIIPNSVTEIESYFFSNMDLTSVVIPESVSSLGDNAFYSNEELCEEEFDDYGDWTGENCWDEPTGVITSVKIYGKNSTANFTTYGTNVFGWADGYSDNDIEFIN